MTDDAKRLFPRLEAIGYKVHDAGPYGWIAEHIPTDSTLNEGAMYYQFKTDEKGDLLRDPRHLLEAEAKAACLAHSRSPEGMVLTMAAKARWLRLQGFLVDLTLDHASANRWEKGRGHYGFCHTDEVDEAAMNALFEAVPT